MNDLMKGWRRVCLGSVAGAALSAASFFAVEALGPHPADAATDKAFTEGLDTCIATRKAVVPHEEGYREGKFLAQIINVVSQEGMAGVSGERIQTAFLTKRSSFPGVAAVYFQERGKADLAGCYLAKWKPVKTQAWSSVHAGLTDYLTPSLKARFLSIPER